MSEPKIVHILGGGQWQVPSILLAKRLGYRVLVSDPHKERPADSYADIRECVDITDLEGILEVSKRHNIDGILCDTTDVGVPTMAYVAESLGLPGVGFDVAVNFTNKLRMRELTSLAGVPNPIFRPVSTLAEFQAAVLDIGFPLVVKPVDSQSSRGVHIVRAWEQVDGAFEDALRFSRAGKTIAESFLNGTEVTVEGYCVDGAPHVAGISDKAHFSHRPEVANRLTYPADFSTDILERIRQVNEKTVRALGMRTGVTHGEYMVVGSEVFLVEIAARGGGTRIHSHIAPYLAGFSIPEFYLRWVMGDTMIVQPAPERRAANLAFFSFPSGRVKSITGVDEARQIPGVQEILLEVAEGTVIRPPQDDRSRPGHVLVFGQTRMDVLEATARVFDMVQVGVE